MERATGARDLSYHSGQCSFEGQSKGVGFGRLAFVFFFGRVPLVCKEIVAWL